MAERKLVVKIVGDASSVQRSFATATRSTQQFSRELGKAERGVLAGSGVFRSLGRSLAFASGGFLAFGGAAAFLRKSIDAAKEAAVTQAQLATQLQNSGKSFADYRGQIEKTITRLTALSGFEDDELAAGLTTILRTVPSVSKGLRDLGTAADLARAKHISLSQAALIIAKTEAGNTTLLRRQGFQIAKNAKVEQALATLRQTVAGQAAAGTTEQERFGAVLHQTEEIIGTGLLPTLNKYLISGTAWLEQMNESGKLQKNVAAAADGFSSAISAAAGIVKTVDRVTGSFKNTLELLLALKFASFATNAAAGIGLIGKASQTAAERVALLRGSLTKLGLIGAVTVVVEVVIHRKQVDDTINDLQRRFARAQRNFKPIQLLAKGESEVANAPGIKQGLGLLGIKNVTPESLLQPVTRLKDGLDKVSSAADAMGDKVALAGAKAAHGLALAAQAAVRSAEVTKRALNITAEQRNTFFDNAIARILLRGGLGEIQDQIGALQRANALIEARLKATKDVTRRLHLEDELLQNVAQIKSLNTQQAADALQKRQDAVSEVIARLQLGVTKAQATASFADDIAALKALQAGIKAFGATADLEGQLFDAQQQILQARRDQAAKRISDLTARQFRQLGLSATGDAITPGVANLKKRLQQITANIAGTTFDTPKLEAQLARFRKVLSEGLVPKDVRAKIKELLDGIADDLKNHSGKLTKFAKLDTSKFVEGITGLTPAQVKQLRAGLSQIGAGSTVPQGSFAAAGGGGVVVVHHETKLDGAVLERSTTRHQQKRKRRNPAQKRGPHAGA